jgi:hypothetical protein
MTSFIVPFMISLALKLSRWEIEGIVGERGRDPRREDEEV